jgi:hypothetical protein
MRRISIVFFLLVSFFSLHAQTNNSPYSILGIGDLEDNAFNRTSGMASTGIAYRSPRNLINNNPASLSGLENQFFDGEISIRGKFVAYSGNSVNPNYNSSTDITFRKFALGTKIFKHWGSSIGLTPYSSENYEFNAPVIITGTNNEVANSYSQGYGSINRAYFANGYEFFHHLSVGVTVSYIFGSINEKNILQNPSLPSAYVSTNNQLSLQNVLVDYGLQYYGKINKHFDYIIGGTFSNKTDMQAESSVLILAIDSSQLLNQVTKVSTFTLPVSYGIGASITKDKKYTLLFDYKAQNWGALKYTGFNYALQNSQRYSLGFEISHKKAAYNTVYEASYLHLGLYYYNTYLNVYGQPIKDMGITAGFGINSKRNPLSYAVSLQYGQKGTEVNQLIKEKYAALTIVLSYRDLWFTKGRKFN